MLVALAHRLPWSRINIITTNNAGTIILVSLHLLLQLPLQHPRAHTRARPQSASRTVFHPPQDSPSALWNAWAVYGAGSVVVRPRAFLSIHLLLRHLHRRLQDLLARPLRLRLLIDQQQVVVVMLEEQEREVAVVVVAV
jgi:hypothetical protein